MIAAATLQVTWLQPGNLTLVWLQQQPCTDKAPVPLPDILTSLATGFSHASPATSSHSSASMACFLVAAAWLNASLVAASPVRLAAQAMLRSIWYSQAFRSAGTIWWCDHVWHHNSRRRRSEGHDFGCDDGCWCLAYAFCHCHMAALHPVIRCSIKLPGRACLQHSLCYHV